MKKFKIPQTGHTLAVVPAKGAPETRLKHYDGGRLYEVRNFDEKGVVFLCLARQQKQWLVWYRNGHLWSGYGKTQEAAINGAIRDGWMYATEREAA